MCISFVYYVVYFLPLFAREVSFLRLAQLLPSMEFVSVGIVSLPARRRG